MSEDYDLFKHRHVFASWAAGRASSSPNCRFNVSTAKFLIEKSGLPNAVESLCFFDADDKLAPNTKFDEWHNQICNHLISIVVGESNPIVIGDFTYGVAAKLVNVYLKSILVCGGYDNQTHIGQIHPPIDRVLLDSLARSNFGGHHKEWRKARDKGWSNFNAGDYLKVIGLIRKSLGENVPLWKIEQYWQGHQ